MEHLMIWLAFGGGLLVRWGDRIQHVVADDPEHTLKGYLQHNYVRLIVRVLSTAAIFQFVFIEQGAVGTNLAAFMTGYASDTILDSVLERAKKQGETLVGKIKGN